MLEHLRPLYTKSFRCLGSHCDDNCCRAWEVPIEQAAYERYQRDPSLQPHLKEYFTLLGQNGSEGRYALIKLTPQSTCPFLSVEGLCRLQQQYGEAYLAEVCANYPRNPHRVDGLLERPLSLSCIEAARLVLFNPNLLPQNETGRSPYGRLLRLPDQAVPQNGNKFRYFWEVREFCLTLIQDRTYPLWQRLFLLGMFCKRLGELLAERQFVWVAKLLHDYSEIVSSGRLRAELEAIPARAGAQVQMVMEVAFGYLRQHGAGLCRIHECLQDFLEGIGYSSDSSLESCTRRYTEAHTGHYAAFMKKYPYLLENYLINHIFRVVFPFGQVPAEVFERPEKEFLLMCLEFAVLKGLLIGAAGRYREAFSPEHVAKVAQSLAKSFEHDASLGGALNWSGLRDTNCVAALLKT